ncbi:dicarboxylate symporter family protein [Anaplasma phagocytophilum str. ApMUC09]|uniref:Dicarboxylate symporter family protein n=1 Tax=Anaplasma phagocytophilum str. ApMUC09 TaxID=1359152 RepID=A0A0F3N8Q8_ANAPH|nr:dicarboxylate symporter family protein [Anaplasma phagocytophilum str. ApMUC09]
MKIGNTHAIKFSLLLIAVISAFCFADFVPYTIRSFSYAISLTIKEVIVFLLPFIVFSIVFQSVSKLQGYNAIKVVFLLLGMVFLSNAASISVAHVVGKIAIGSVSENLTCFDDAKPSVELLPYYSFSLPRHISSLNAVILGFLSGMLLPRMLGKKSEKLSSMMATSSVFALEKGFAPILPVFIVGLVFKMQSDNLLDILVRNANVALLLFCSALLYISFLYFVAAGFSVREGLRKFKGMLPASLFAFTTMSSLITMPIILKAVKKDSQDGDIADIAVPTALNVHLVGDCFFIIVMALVISAAFNGVGCITTSSYLAFLLYFLLAKFAVVAIPGGGIIVMLPIIEQYLNFSPTMLSLITTLYVVFDPAITSMNVLGNGAFAMLFVRVHRLFVKNV